MGAYKYIKQSFQQEYKERSDLLKSKIAAWREEESVKKVEKPTNIARARNLGYKAKQGVVVARVKIRRGLRKRPKPRGGRKPSKSGRFFAHKKSFQSMAEDRAGRKFSNCEVVNSYYVGEDGQYLFYEVILADRAHGAVLADPNFSGIVQQRGRSFRGLTSSGIKHRGLTGKGLGTERNRPSVRSNERSG
ncbi:MAG: 50S ribosomal protein L15e [Candidatus Marsarchaeota archaeon]|jgi:large subunit ribosomal protein L15e|nr:50S ribosomal protein L15e [Candidatus Marsarchaeota archaeon]